MNNVSLCPYFNCSQNLDVGVLLKIYDARLLSYGLSVGDSRVGLFEGSLGVVLLQILGVSLKVELRLCCAHRTL